MSIFVPNTIHMIDRLISFLNASPVNFLAVEEISRQLDAAGFKKYDMASPNPDFAPGEGFYMIKNGSAIFAVRMGTAPVAEAGFKLICAHCDSPTFRIKPASAMMSEGGIVRLNTEVYGGPILSTWFDRPLSIAGRVILRSEDPLHPKSKTVIIERPILTIPNLAIHFNRQVNDGVKLNRQKDMLPLMDVSSLIDENLGKDGLILKLLSKKCGINEADILDFDLYLYDTTPACTIGLKDEFIQSGRLDDLSMAFAGLEAMLASKPSAATQVLAIFDNEETGSGTKQGAHSPVLRNLLKRICGGSEAFYRAMEQSFMISADNAHAFHPNYADKYDPTNHPVLGGGPAIKINAAQKYATDADSAAVFKEICRTAGVPCQSFVNHSEVAGGSTLGNILTAQMPLRGVDMGNPIWAMHSCRETGSCADHVYCVKAFTAFYNI